MTNFSYKKIKLLVLTILFCFWFLSLSLPVLAGCLSASVDFTAGDCASGTDNGTTCCAGLVCESKYNSEEGYSIFRCRQPAQEDTTDHSSKPLLAPILEVDIPGLKLSDNITPIEDAGSNFYRIPWLAEYMKGVYRFGVGAAAILAIMMIMIGGVLWMTAGGNQERVTNGKKYIAGALAGLVLALSSYTILRIVNPALVYLSPTKLPAVQYEKLEVMPLAESSEAIVSGQLEPGALDQTYGTCTGNMCGDPGTVKLSWVNFPVKGTGKAQINEQAAGSLERVGQKISAANLGGYQLVNGGTFCCRPNVNKPKLKSLHCYGLAIDLNPNTNPNYRKEKGDTTPCKTDLPSAVINAFTSEGWVWGGNFRTVCDSMHFEWHGK